MKLSTANRSSMVEDKTAPRGAPGKTNRMLYETPEYKATLKDISQQFQDATRGKGDRQNGPDSPMTTLIKRSIQQRNVFGKK